MASVSYQRGVGRMVRLIFAGCLPQGEVFGGSGAVGLENGRREFRAVNATIWPCGVLMCFVGGVKMGRKPKPPEQRMAFFTARASGTSLRKSAAPAGISWSTACLWLKQSGACGQGRRSCSLRRGYRSMSVRASRAERVSDGFCAGLRIFLKE